MHVLPNYDNEERPWGFPERFTANETTTVKLLHLYPGKRFSLQVHAHRKEFWRVIEGTGKLTVGEETREVRKGDEALIPTGTKHRLEAGPYGLHVLEIIFGDYDENDIERFEDDFGRV